MGITKLFKKMKPEDRMRWAMRKKQEAEKEERFWTRICRKLAEDKSFTPMEEDLIDTVLTKQK